MRYILLCFGISLSIGAAQTPGQTNTLLSALAGSWTGTIESDGIEFFCAQRYAFTLQDAFLEGTLRVCQDKEMNVAVLEERSFFRQEREAGGSCRSFTSRGNCGLGAWSVAHGRWTVTTAESDGSQKISTLEMDGDDRLSIHSTVQSEEGEILGTTRTTLTRQP